MHSYNYTMEMGFVDQIRLTQQKIFGKLVDCLKLNWNFTRTTYISSMDYTQTIPTVSHTPKFHLYFSNIFNTSANNLCCCCYLGSYLVEIPKFVLVFLCCLLVFFFSVATFVYSIPTEHTQ